MQRPGGAPDDSDLVNPFTKMFNFGKKKEEPPQTEEPRKTNWWTL